MKVINHKEVQHRLLMFILFVFITVKSLGQSPEDEFPGRLTSVAKKQKLSSAIMLGDITPELWRKMVMPYKERMELEELRKVVGYSIYPWQDNYYSLINYVSVEISVTKNGRVISAESKSDKLTAEQQNILKAAELNSVINIRMMFKPKYDLKRESDKIMEGSLNVTVIPDVEASYEGGFDKITEYIKQNVRSKVNDAHAAEKIQMAMVNFIVDENGLVTDVKLTRTSGDKKIDNLLLDATRKMPGWKPAKHNGIKVKQEFNIALGFGC